MSRKKKSKSAINDLYKFEDEDGNVKFSWIKKKGKHKRAKVNTTNK